MSVTESHYWIRIYHQLCQGNLHGIHTFYYSYMLCNVLIYTNMTLKHNITIHASLVMVDCGYIAQYFQVNTPIASLSYHNKWKTCLVYLNFKHLTSGIFTYLIIWTTENLPTTYFLCRHFLILSRKVSSEYPTLKQNLLCLSHFWGSIFLIWKWKTSFINTKLNPFWYKA